MVRTGMKRSFDIAFDDQIRKMVFSGEKSLGYFASSGGSTFIKRP